VIVLVAVLVLLGVISGVARSLMPATLGERAEPMRLRLLHALHRDDPHADVRAAEIRRVEGRFAAHPTVIFLHALCGTLFLILAPLQLLPNFRARHVVLHRRSGVLLIGIGVITACTGVYFGVLHPAAGIGEVLVIAIVSALFLWSLARAVIAIRKRHLSTHRHWMIRAFAVAIGISTVRIVAMTADFFLTPAGFTLVEIFVLSLWAGWGITIGAAEVWIRSQSWSLLSSPAPTYWAFISYASTDAPVAAKLRRRLENYRLPRDLVGRPGRDVPLPSRLFPIFRDREELPLVGDLAASIKSALSASRYLIVVCSPEAAKSRWVNEEILYFMGIGRADRILAIIVGGEPNASDDPDEALPECFPPAFRNGHGRTEPAAGDLRPGGDGWTAVVLKAVAGITGLGLDAFVRRERKRRRLRQVVAGIALSMLLAGGLWTWDYNRLKVAYFANIGTRWGAPEGVGAVDTEARRGRESHFRFELSRRQVRRILCVNSAGQLRDEMEGGAAIQNVSYRQDGTVQQIDWRDHNERLVMRQTFNERRETVDGMVQYVDFHAEDHDEPFALDPATGVFGQIDDPPVSSQITANQFLYDANGRIARVMYLNGYRQSRPNMEGIFGQRFTYDGPALLPNSIESLGLDAMPAPGRFGVTRVNLSRGPLGDVIEGVYLGLNGQPALSNGDCHRELLRLDAHGNVTEFSGFGIDNQPALYRHGSHRSTQQFDSRGNMTGWAHFGIDGKPTLTSDGVHSASRSFDVRGNVTEWSYFGVDGKPVLYSDGCHKGTRSVDIRGNTTESSCFGIDGKPIVDKNGVHTIRSHFDASGDRDEESYLGVDGKPTTNRDGIHKIDWWFPNPRGHPTVQFYFGVDGKPTVDVDGVYKTTWVFDVLGNPAEVAYFGVDYAPVQGPDGFHRITQEFDDGGNQTGTAYFGIDGKPVLSPEGFHRVTELFDVKKNRSERAVFGVDGKATTDSDGVHKRIFSFDGRGSLTEESFFGIDGKPGVSSEGFHKRTYLYDDRGNAVARASFHIDGRPAADREGVHKRIYRIDARGNILEAACFDIEGKPAVDADGLHKATWAYDARDNPIMRTGFGVDGKPAVSKDGTHISRTRYDARGNAVELAFFDRDDQPTVDREGIHRRTFLYDARGNLAEVAYFGVHGERATDRKGIHKKTWSHDSLGKMTGWGTLGIRVKRLPGGGSSTTETTHTTEWVLKPNQHDQRSGPAVPR